MNEEKIYEEIMKILKVHTKDPSLWEKATASTDILKDLQINSARLVDIIIKCEDVFNVIIEDEEAEQIRNIGDAVNLIKRKLH